MFRVFRYGYGALCLEWPENKKEPRYMVKVTESLVDDFKAIQLVVPCIRKEKKDPNRRH